MADFIDVTCPDCKNTQKIFSHAAMEVKCNKCTKVIVFPRGGKIKIIS